MINRSDPPQASNDVGIDSPRDSRHEPPKLQAMGFGEILDTTFSLYRTYFRSFLTIASGYFFLILIGVSIVFLDDSVGRIEKIIIWTATIVTIIGVSTFVVSGLVLATTSAYLERKIKIGAVLKHGIRRFFACFFSSLLFASLAIFFVFLFSLLFAMLYLALIKEDDLPYLVPGGFVLLIGTLVIGWFGTFWSFYIPTILVEGESVWVGLRRSRNLIRGTWWRTGGMVLSIFLLSFTISFILRTTFGFLLNLTELTDETLIKTFRMALWDIPTTRRGLSFSKALMYVGNLGADTFTMPIWVIGGTLLYFDQRIRKEGFDLEVMAAYQGASSARDFPMQMDKKS